MPGQSLSSKFLGSFELYHGSHQHLTTGIVIYGKKLRRKKVPLSREGGEKKNFKAWSNIWIIFVAAPATKIETNPRMFLNATCFFLEKINCRLFSLFLRNKEILQTNILTRNWRKEKDHRTLFHSTALALTHTYTNTLILHFHAQKHAYNTYMNTNALTPMIMLPYIWLSF